MIAATRFIARSSDREVWLGARRGAVTATEVAKAATPSGFLLAAEERRNPTEIIPNAYMEFGTDNEAWIADNLKAEFGIFHNEWLIAADGNPLHRATPDGLSLDHTEISEIKTGGKEAYVSPPIQYRRQIQFQLYVSGAERCLYAFMLRAEVNDVLVPAWLSPKTQWVDRDEAMIRDLVSTADLLLELDKEWMVA